MAMVCPQCFGSFEQHLDCPACGVRLLYQVRRGAEDQWQQTPWGRIVVGLLLAQGLAYGLQLFVTGWLLANDETNRTLWTTPWGILLLYGLQGISLLIGGAIAGAGQVRGLLYGSFVGLVNGLIFLMINLGRGEIQNEVAFYSQPMLHLAFGAMGGLIGTLIWRPLPTLRLQGSAGEAGKVKLSSGLLFFSGPIRWTRVLAGILVAVAGVAWSPSILAFIMEMGQGLISIDSNLQAKLVTWEISAIAVLLGAGLAGATTPNGPKQGLVVGLGAGVLLFGISLGNPRAAFQASEFLVAALICLTLAGGWFGSQLFPPLGVAPQRKRIAAF
jgi:hypothetical protein